MSKCALRREHKGWELLEIMPDGWSLDPTTGSPLHGYKFITNGKSVLNNQKRALLKVTKRARKIETEEPKAKIIKKTDEVVVCKKTIYDKDAIIDGSCVQAVNELARKQCEEHLLNDIMLDLMICEIEGWGKKEYIDELKKIIGGLLIEKPIIHQQPVGQGVLF